MSGFTNAILSGDIAKAQERVFKIDQGALKEKAAICFISALMYQNKLSQGRAFIIKSLNTRVLHPYMDNKAYVTVFVALHKLKMNPEILFKFETKQKDQELRACQIAKLMLDQNLLIEAAEFGSSILPEKHRFKFSCELLKRQSKENSIQLPSSGHGKKRKLSLPYERKFPR